MYVLTLNRLIIGLTNYKLKSSFLSAIKACFLIFSAPNSGIKGKERTKKKEPKKASKKVKAPRVTLSQSGKNIIMLHEYF